MTWGRFIERGRRRIRQTDGALEVWCNDDGAVSAVKLDVTKITEEPGPDLTIRTTRFPLTEPLTPTALQRFPWARMLAAADAGRRELWATSTRFQADSPKFAARSKKKLQGDELRRAQTFSDIIGDAFGDGFRLDGTRRRPGRRGHPDEFYKAVAGRYLQLRKEGVTDPTNRLAAEHGHNRSTAAGWVSVARKRGYLPPARRSRAG